MLKISIKGMIEHSTYLQEKIKKRVSIYKNLQLVSSSLETKQKDYLLISLATIHQMSTSSFLTVTGPFIPSF